MFSTFLECSQMSRVFYYSVIHGLGFFVCFMIYRGNVAKNNKARFYFVLYSDKTGVFDQSERAQGPIYIISTCIGFIARLIPLTFKKYKTCTVFLSSYRNTSGSLGEREMLWEHELQASVFTAFSSSPKFSRVFL